MVVKMNGYNDDVYNAFYFSCNLHDIKMSYKIWCSSDSLIKHYNSAKHVYRKELTYLLTIITYF